MKWYVDSQSRLLVMMKILLDDRRAFSSYMDKNLISRYDTCYGTFSKNLRTMVYDDTTKVGLEIVLDGSNFTGNVDKNPGYEKFVTILKEMIERTSTMASYKSFKSSFAPAIPTGLIIPWSHNSIPNGFWFAADKLSRTTYADLFALRKLTVR